jgi:hypothetical protein
MNRLHVFATAAMILAVVAVAWEPVPLLYPCRPARRWFLPLPL